MNEERQFQDNTPSQAPQEPSRAREQTGGFPWMLSGVSLAVVLALVAGVWFFMSGGFDSRGPVATVNGEEISRSLFNERLTQQEAAFGPLEGVALVNAREQIIDTLVVESLLMQGAREMNITVTDEEVNEQISTVKEQLGGEEGFAEELRNEGLTENELRELFRDQLMMQKYIEASVDIESVTATGEEVRNFYNQAVEGQEEAPSFEEVQDQVRESIIQQKQQQLVQEFIQGLRDQSEIVIL